MAKNDKDTREVIEPLMTVRMQTIYSSPRGNCGIGKCIKLPQSEALQLIEDKCAEEVKEKVEVVPTQEAQENQL